VRHWHARTQTLLLYNNIFELKLSYA
jgi:hypothetical protein